MKATRLFKCFFAAALLLSAFSLQPSALRAQGSLTPPGAPAPVMKTLDQVYAKLDARIPITNSASLATITSSGSYYLTTHLTVSTGDGIDINTNGVTLDLNGFTITSTAASATGTGILLASGLRNITIANGFIQGGVTNNGSGVYNGGGFGYGIFYSGNQPVNVLVSRVSVSGCRYSGIYLANGNSMLVDACTVRTVGSYGITAGTVKGCSALDCGGLAIYGDEVSDCRGQCSGSDYGLSAAAAQNCVGICGSGTGLYAYNALNCYGYSGSGTGLYAYNAQNCYGQSSSYTGVYASTAQNCYGYSSGAGAGLSAATAQNCVGISGSGTGLSAAYTASSCTGSSSSGTGLNAFIANVCHGISSTGTALTTTHNVNSF